MEKLLIIQTGTTFDAIRTKHGDFDQFIIQQIQHLPVQIEVLSVYQEPATLPDPADLNGVIITGSHSMVSEHEPWSERLAAWIKQSRQHSLPILGICYGHQLIAHAFGGQVDYHPQGPEVGTVEVRLTEAGLADPLLGVLPARFAAHVTHAQSVLTLPAGAKLLAFNHYEPHEAFVVDQHIWGVQFHPEFTQDIERQYLLAQTEPLTRAGKAVDQLYADVSEHPYGKLLLERFVALVKGWPV